MWSYCVNGVIDVGPYVVVHSGVGHSTAGIRLLGGEQHEEVQVSSDVLHLYLNYTYVTAT